MKPESLITHVGDLEHEIRKCKKYIWKNSCLDLKKKIVLFLISIQFPRKILVELWSGGKK